MFEKIKSLCNEKNISIYMLEKELNFSVGSIIKWKKSQPTVERLKAVADYLGVTLDYLVRD